MVSKPAERKGVKQKIPNEHIGNEGCKIKKPSFEGFQYKVDSVSN